MFLIKELSYNHFMQHNVVNNGLSLAIDEEKNNKLFCSYFWGGTEVEMGPFFDRNKIEKTAFALETRLTYINEYFVKKDSENKVVMELKVSKYEPNNIEGYFIIIRKNSRKITTSGEKIFGRNENEIVAILREGDYLIYDAGKIKVINGELVLVL